MHSWSPVSVDEESLQKYRCACGRFLFDGELRKLNCECFICSSLVCSAVRDDTCKKCGQAAVWEEAEEAPHHAQAVRSVVGVCDCGKKDGITQCEHAAHVAAVKRTDDFAPVEAEEVKQSSNVLEKVGYFFIGLGTGIIAVLTVLEHDKDKEKKA